jgi:ubiquinone/menaquinone biosynthesis C-methylase UbiE
MTTDTIPTWDRYTGTPAEIYERHFVPAIGRPFAERVVEAAAPRAGERVLDVACGTGIVARIAAERVGEDGLVVGVDGHPGMLATARTTCPDGDWRQASAEGLPFDEASFDAVLCSLGLQFFADKHRALDEVRRVLRPGGRTAIATAGPTPAALRALRDVLADHLGDEVAAIVDAVFTLDDTERLREMMTAVGLANVETSRQPIQLRLDPPADFFWQYVLGTPLAEHVTDVDADRRAALERDIVDRWQPFAADEGLRIDVDMVLGTATATA